MSSVGLKFSRYTMQESWKSMKRKSRETEIYEHARSSFEVGAIIVSLAACIFMR